jgi:hypothetical protein
VSKTSYRGDLRRQRIFHHKFAVTGVIVCHADPVRLDSTMTSTDQEKTVRFINASREHRQWLSRELSILDARCENYESNQRAIRGAMGELDKVIWKAMKTAGMLGSCRTTVTPDGISARELTDTVSSRCPPAK